MTLELGFNQVDHHALVRIKVARGTWMFSDKRFNVSHATKKVNSNYFCEFPGQYLNFYGNTLKSTTYVYVYFTYQT